MQSRIYLLLFDLESFRAFIGALLKLPFASVQPWDGTASQARVELFWTHIQAPLVANVRRSVGTDTRCRQHGHCSEDHDLKQHCSDNRLVVVVSMWSGLINNERGTVRLLQCGTSWSVSGRLHDVLRRCNRRRCYWSEVVTGVTCLRYTIDNLWRHNLWTLWKSENIRITWISSSR